MDKSREAVSEDARPTYPSVDAYEFIDTALPRVPEAADAMNDIISWVKTESGEYSNGRWKSFTMDPADYRQPETRIFTKLCAIVNAIHTAVGKCLPELHSNPQTWFYTRTSNLSEAMRPDGCFILDNERSRSKDPENPDWVNMAVTGAHKKDDTTAATRDNTTQILLNMHYVFREDPRRHRTFGYAIENRTFRMWCGSRSGIVGSNPVDFFTDPECIIRFFFAFMYASPTEMGWDPTMKMTWDGGNHIEPQYDITVQSKEGKVKVFRTISLISAVGAESICGRGTRVWQVREVGEDGLSDKIYVLKDSWIDSDRESEDEVVAQIEKEARATLSPSESAILIKCLLTTFIAGPVILGSNRSNSTIDGRKRTRLIEGITSEIVSKQAQKSSTPSFQPLATEPPYRQDDSQTSALKTKLSMPICRVGALKPPGTHHESPDDKGVDPKPVVYSAKNHYRIVFEEVCEVLHEIKSLQTVIWALRQTCIALRLLHKLGWVHRDLSSGNLMVGHDQLKIADFEYAKKMTEPRTEVQDTCTGTEDFMSVEVRSQEYLFTEQIPGFAGDSGDDIDTEDEDDDDSEDEGTSYYEELANTDVGGSNLLFALKTRVPKKARTTWFYNPLHDFESIFWLTLHFLINKDFHCTPDAPASAPGVPRGAHVVDTFEAESDDQRKSRIVNHWNFCRSLFAGRAGRTSILEMDGTLARFLDENPLHPALEPLDRTLERMRKILVAAYRRVERDTSTVTHKSARRLPEKFVKLLDRAVRHVGGTGHLISIQSLKRAVDALPMSDEMQCENAPLTRSSCSASFPKKRRKPMGDKSARLQKSSRLSLDHTSPTFKPSSSGGKTGKRKTGQGHCAPFMERIPQYEPSYDISTPHLSSAPPTRVLRSHTRTAVDPAPAPSASTSTALSRAHRITTVGRKTRDQAKSEETANTAAKAMSKPKSRSRKVGSL